VVFRAWTSGAGEQLLFSLIIALAGLPLAGWPLPAGWLAVTALLVLGEQRLRATRSPADPSAVLCRWLRSVSYSLAALYFVLLYTGPAQTFGVTLYGVMMFRILTKDYADRRRLLLNLAPPALSMFAAQAAALVGLIGAHRTFEILSLLASPAIVFLAFRAVQDDLNSNLRRAVEATARAEDSARRINEAHRITLMAEEMAGVGHWSLDVASGVSSWSDAVYRIHGLSSSRKIPKFSDILAMYGPADRELVRASVERSIRHAEPFTYEARITRPDGQVAYVVSSGAAERGADGNVATVFGTFMDVTQARVREAELQSSEARYRLLADHSTDIIAWVALDGLVLYVSPSVRALGYSPEALVGGNIADFIHPEDRERALARHEALFAGRDADFGGRPEYRLCTRDGRLAWYEASATVVRDDAGRAVSAVTSLRNVSARRRLQDDLLDAKLSAEAAVEAKAEFLANMSHEIRTPLTGIIGFSGLLDEIEGLPPTARTYAQRIATSGRALLAVVNDILDFSKLEAGQVELDPHPFDTRRFFDDTLAIFSGEAAAKRLEVALEIDGAVPAALDADSARLRQVVTNLISNAIKFTDQGRICVAVGYEAERRRLLIEVRDTGVGVAPDKLDRLFKRFSQVDGSVSRRHGGTGLGLSICKALVDLMGGEIGVVSTVRVGSTFSLWIPAAQVEADDEAPDEDAAGDRLDAAPARVLVVDDLAVNRELVRAILEATGHCVAEASSGAEAVEMALGAPYDLILMDLQMPGMDGFSAARAIRALAAVNRMTPIIALSANVLPEHVEACGAAGMNDHIAKPVSPAELIGAVAHWTQARPQPTAAEDLRHSA
jgi:PAS domain S-box-containing protein